MAPITLAALKERSDWSWNLSLGKFTTATVCAAAAVMLTGVWNTGAAESLAEAMAMAYQNNPTLQAERAALRARDEGVPQARAGWRPNLDIVGRGGYTYQYSDNGDTDDGASYSASLRLTQNVYAGGGTLADVRRARNAVKAGRARLGITEQDVLSRAVSAYVDVARDTAVLQLNINNEKVLRRQQEATRDRFNVGEVTRTDVAQADARLARARADRIRAQGDLKIRRGVYEQIIGKAPGRLTNPDTISDLPSDRDQALEWADAGNPSVVAARFDEQAARDGVDVFESELLPKLDVIGEGGRTKDYLLGTSAMNAASVTAQLTIPLYQRGFVSSRVREAKQIAGRDRLRLAVARRAAAELANNAWESLVTTRARIVSINSEVRASRIALEGVRQEALVGSRTVLDVLDAEQELLDAQVNLVRAQRDETLAQYQLAAAVGRLTAKGLNLDVKTYDAVKHYNAVQDKLWGLGGSIDK
jgi:TolC family type I secretion outer membrane protein